MIGCLSMVRSMLLVSFCLVATLLSAQDASLKVAISKNYLVPGDTLDLQATYQVGNRQLPPATFALTLLGPANKVWQMRWPMVEGTTEASIIFPDSIPVGRYTLLFAVQPRFLRLFGELVYPPKVKQVTAIFGDGFGRRTERYAVGPGGRFEIGQVFLEGSIGVSFLHDNTREPGPPLLKLDAWLDSAYQPAAVSATQVVVNTPQENIYTPGRVRKDSILLKLGESVLQFGYEKRRAALALSHLEPLRLYDSLYVPGWLKQGQKEMIDCLADTVQQKYASAYDLLVQRNPGLRTGNWAEEEDIRFTSGFQTIEQSQVANELMLKVNRKWYRIYHGGKYGDPTVLTLPPSAFAMIKVYEPPFYTESGTNWKFGIIAFFDREFPLGKPFPYFNQFTIHGYSPSEYRLSLQ